MNRYQYKWTFDYSTLRDNNPMYPSAILMREIGAIHKLSTQIHVRKLLETDSKSPHFCVLLTWRFSVVVAPMFVSVPVELIEMEFLDMIDSDSESDSASL